MRTIWKFPFEIADELMIEMPKNAQILSAQVQHGQPCLWAIVDSDESTSEQRWFSVRGTGQPCSGEGQFIGTIQLMNGSLVFHVFEALFAQS